MDTSLLDQVERERMQRRETLRAEVRQQLKAVLAELAPGEKVYVFGSLVHPNKFHDRSDVDLAFVEEPRKGSQFRIQSLIEESLNRPVDLLILNETRLKDKILREGELWTN
jgi:predicted nucleotidyltransferase